MPSKKAKTPTVSSNGRKLGRPSLGKVRLGINLSAEARDYVLALGVARGISTGVIIEDLLWAEKRREEEAVVHE
jgi:hypothetical protein